MPQEIVEQNNFLEIARFRQGAYRLLSSWFIYPDAFIVSIVQETTVLLRHYDGMISHLAFFNNWSQFLKELEKLESSQLPSLQESYMELFGESNAFKPISLCESNYLSSRSTTMEWVLKKLAHQYQQRGLISNVQNVPDHISVELEFLSFLCSCEYKSWQNNLCSTLQELQHQYCFLRDHLYLWLPGLAKIVAARDSECFYNTLMQITWALVAHDTDFTKSVITLLKSNHKEQCNGNICNIKSTI